MLSKSMVEEIVRHLAEGKLSRCQIARRFGVGRSTVSAIALGKRGLHGRSEEPSSLEPDPFSAPVRCAKCGYRVHPPCLVCRTREYHRARQILATHPKRSPRPVRCTRGRAHLSRPHKFQDRRREVA